MAISSDINHVRAIERNRQNDCSPFQTKNFSNIWGIGENDGVGRLNPEISIPRSLRRYRERGIISHGVEDGNDFTDRVVSRRDRLLLVIRVRDHISRIHVGENDGLDMNRTVMEVMEGSDACTDRSSRTCRW